MEDEFTLEILSKIPFSLQLLDVINQVLDDDTAYWGKSSYAIRLLRRRDRSVKDNCRKACCVQAVCDSC